ncbi:hypothetical protein [Novosphingobium resinovorum]|uniref:hypothetical protein n=1 Tax=Novosphingobium resinovorum TaxID=158500 RepID=UPI003341609F
MLWRLRRGTPWRDVPPKYGNRNTIYLPFRRCRSRGLGGGVGHVGRGHDSRHYSIDSTTVRAHVSAAVGNGVSSTSSWPIAGRVYQSLSR